MLNRRNEIYEYYHQKTNHLVTLRPIDLAQDLNTLYDWTHYPHVIPNWQLNKPKEELSKHFKKSLSDKHQLLFMVAINCNEICYAEVYSAAEDRLANFYNILAGDYGIHLFIGPPTAIGKGHSESILAALTDYLFTRHKATRILLEPNQNVTQFTVLKRKLGYSILGTIKLPEKTAILYAVDSSAFYEACPYTDYPLKFNSKTLTCDTRAWPIVKIHFPDYPSDGQVIAWLNDVNQILAKNETCIVISSFEKHYQFSTIARRYQALWFKDNAKRLADNCLAMIRITRDKIMREKITSNAMRKGMPFICIPADTLNQASAIAERILNKHFREQACKKLKYPNL